MSIYSEKLKDPRWQKRRLEILERDNWTCQICGDKTSTLTGHHKIYLPHKEPWDYPNNILTTLCEDCNLIEKEDMPPILSSIMQQLPISFSSTNLLPIDDGLTKANPIKEADGYLLAESIREMLINIKFRNFILKKIWELANINCHSKFKKSMGY